MAAKRTIFGFNPIVPITSPLSRISNPNTAVIEKKVESEKLKEDEKKRARGKATTLLTGPNGLLGAPGVTKRTLIGY